MTAVGGWKQKGGEGEDGRKASLVDGEMNLWGRVV